MVGPHNRTTCRCLSKKLEILPIPHHYIFSLMNFIVDNQKYSQTNQSIVLKQALRNIFTDHLPTYTVFRRVYSVLEPEFSKLYHVGSEIFESLSRPL